MVLRSEKLVRKTDRTAPERERAIREPPVELGGHREAIVFVVLLVFEATSDLVPHGAPGWRYIEPEPLRKTGGIAEWKIKAEKDSLITCRCIRQQLTE